MSKFLPGDAGSVENESEEHPGYTGSLRMAILEVGSRAIRAQGVDDGTCYVLRPVGGDEVGSVSDTVPGEIVRIRPLRERSFGKIRCVSAEIAARGLDVEALELTPLQLFARGHWGPLENARDAAADSDGGAEGEAGEDRAAGGGTGKDEGAGGGTGGTGPDVNIQRDLLLELVQGTGPRPASEMERVDPGGSAPIDLRCLDAHARLGLEAFRGHTRKDLARAIRHYRVGVAIGDLTIGPEFEGVLSWSYEGNRPFLRCLHGLGLCWWRLGEPERASEVFRRLLWLDPEDPLGTRALLKQLELGFDWKQSYTAQSGPVAVESMAGRR